MSKICNQRDILFKHLLNFRKQIQFLGRYNLHNISPKILSN